MQIGSLLSAYNPRAVSPQLPDKSSTLDFKLAGIATDSKEGNKPSQTSPLFADGVTSVLLQEQEYKEDIASLEKQLEGMLEGSTPEEMISEISSMAGFMKWQIKELTRKATAEVMAGMGITMEDLKAMPAEQKIAVMKQIMDAVREKIQQAMEEQMKKDGKSPLLSLNSIDIAETLAS